MAPKNKRSSPRRSMSTGNDIFLYTAMAAALALALGVFSSGSSAPAPAAIVPPAGNNTTAGNESGAGQQQPAVSESVSVTPWRALHVVELLAIAGMNAVAKFSEQVLGEKQKFNSAALQALSFGNACVFGASSAILTFVLFDPQTSLSLVWLSVVGVFGYVAYANFVFFNSVQKATIKNA